MADRQHTESPEKRAREADSYFTSHASSSSSRQTSSRPGFERQSTAPLRTQLATIRSPSSPGPTSPGAPRTPVLNRSFSSPFASPRADFTASDEMFVLEFGSRYLRVGLGGEKRPRCIQTFGPDSQRRVGDYSKWMGDDASSKTPEMASQNSWGQGYELWRTHLLDLDLGLVRDKIERAVRDALTQHVLILDDSRRRTHMVAVPAQIPQPLLSILLDVLFNHSPAPPTVCLLTIPMLNLVSAGLRSGLVVDIGWHTTTVTAVYEYREMKHSKSVRAMKAVHWELALLLKRHVANGEAAEQQDQSASDEPQSIPISFEDSEEILFRLLHCRDNGPEATDTRDQTSDPSGKDPIEIPLNTPNQPRSIKLNSAILSQPIETALFAAHAHDSQHSFDDHNLPLATLVYRTLLNLSLDVRETLASRIVVTGGGANIPGLKSRLLKDVQKMVEEKNWDPVHNYGSIEQKVKGKKTRLKTTGPTPVDGNTGERANKDIDPSSTVPASHQDPLPDPILNSIRSRAAEKLQADSQSADTIRGIDTLGAWAGLSLVAGLRVKGAVEIERETFLQHGLLGAPERTDEEEGKRKRQSVMPGQLGQAKAGDRASGSWSLGVFG